MGLSSKRKDRSVLVQTLALLRGSRVLPVPEGPVGTPARHALPDALERGSFRPQFWVANLFLPS